jgi:hypothetical protein
MRKPNDVGVAWKKTNERGEYLSIALDVDVLLELAGGAVGKVNLNAYPIISDHPKAPDYQLKYYPKSGTGQPQSRQSDASIPAPHRARPSSRPRDPDDDIPF